MQSSVLDNSKAFVLVHYGKFTNFNVKTNTQCVIRLILYSYIRQKAGVRWKSIKSSYFNIYSGVITGCLVLLGN